ncbi:hypothetical protein CROQUDRAFT_204035 [Cronartium quercuum f. sp. fusiforme G11]|uniref:Uncharacterized protein n=1 Tax=Cronartium quercuum f. sp. fusiforme G11 TaxID=708437 RepID=A0A9P6T8Y4_9BASI|nr:hypothetical protein CROQUDRAFT_204035 [Cronartium quercuum f. sp. fusiforme G11]
MNQITNHPQIPLQLDFLLLSYHNQPDLMDCWNSIHKLFQKTNQDHHLLFHSSIPVQIQKNSSYKLELCISFKYLKSLYEILIQIFTRNIHHHSNSNIIIIITFNDQLYTQSIKFDNTFNQTYSAEYNDQSSSIFNKSLIKVEYIKVSKDRSSSTESDQSLISRLSLIFW